MTIGLLGRVPPAGSASVVLPAVRTTLPRGGAVPPTARAALAPADSRPAAAPAPAAGVRTAPALRCTAVLLVVPAESEPLRPDGDGTAVTTGPPLARATRWTAAGPCPSKRGSPGGSARIRTAGARCTAGVRPANGKAPVRPSSPVTGPAADERRPSPSTALDVPSRTAGDEVAKNDGFCQVGSRPPNPASATEARPAPATGRIGASPAHDAVTAERPGAAESSCGAAPPAGAPTAPEPDASPRPVCGAPRRPRKMSRKPIGQSSAPARVTRAAISPA
ncbi:hypothetical protein [Streptomyces sp. NPDC047315]|uniref:hypothetical protein n=1 Tax=Streptomyces sp. NPDC047315 TaxID=3155142 RepID=UPI003403418E